MVGNILTIADLALYAELKMLWELILVEKTVTAMKNLTRWISLVAEIPEIKSTFGKLRQCKKEFPVANVEKKEEKKEEKKKPQE